MTTTPEGPPPVRSLLYKAAMLGTSSTYLRGMVQAAAKVKGKAYTDDLLWHVATTPALAEALVLEEGAAIDSALLVTMLTQTDVLDTLVLGAVEAYQVTAG